MEHAKPVKKIRVGPVSAAIWTNKSKEGKDYATISLERVYKGKEGWKSTTSLRRNDLPGAVLALHEAYKYLAMHPEAPQDAAQEGI